MSGMIARVNNGQIWVESEFRFKDVLKQIPGAKWSPEHKLWYYPVRPMVALTLAERGATGDDKFVALVAEAKAGAKADSTVKHSTDLPQPEVRKLDAWNHQKQAYHFAKDKPAAMLALDMGTGKSKVTIDIIQNRGHKKVLIICPLKVVSVWPAEFAKHCAMDYSILALDTGSTAEKTAAAARFMVQPNNADKIRIVTINYESAASQAFSKWALKQVWDCVVVDESHRIKRPSGVQSRFVAEVGQHALQRLALTGTPLPHSPLDAYGQYRFLDRSIFGSNFTLFRNRYAIMGGYQNYEILGYKDTEDFNKRFYSIAIKVGKEVLDLPAIQEIDRYCELSLEARKHYRSLEDDFVAYLDGTDGPPVTASNTLVKLLRLQQLTGGHLDHRLLDTSKAELLAEVLDEIGEQEPVVVFANFVEDLAAIQRVCIESSRQYMELSGRINELDTWKACPGGPVIGVQIQAGGVGIDMTKAAYAVYYSTGYSLGNLEQSKARVHRPGQTRTTFYINLLAKGTIDEKIKRAIKEKRDIVSSILMEYQ